MIEPILLKAGDERLNINGQPPKVDCRVIAEDQYQKLLNPKRDWDIRKGNLTICQGTIGRVHISAVQDFYINDKMLIILYENGIKEYRPIDNITYFGFDVEKNNEPRTDIEVQNDKGSISTKS
jgi:hypothetical protein